VATVLDPSNRSARGLIHHWSAAAFIPGSTQESVLAVVDSYARYNTYYQPTVTASKEISRDGEDRQFSMRLLKKVLFVTSALEVEASVRLFRKNEKQSYSLAWSTRIREIENQGAPGEHLLDPGLGSGYVWRVASISRFEQRDGGVYLEVEVMLLSRDISVTAMWLVKPVVSRLSRSAITTFLEQTRKAVHLADGSDRSDAIPRGAVEKPTRRGVHLAKAGKGVHLDAVWACDLRAFQRRALRMSAWTTPTTVPHSLQRSSTLLPSTAATI
jgi:hypothetical protein